jgi:hypothetical protein
MTDRRWWLKLLTLMRQQEEKMQELYRTYAQLFPGHAAAWQRLSATEMEHADWVSILQTKLQEGSVHIDEGRLPLITAYESAQREVDREIARAGATELTPAQAFSTALRLEKSLLESELFSFFAGDSRPLQELLKYLKRGTEQHIKELEQFVETETGP